MVGVSFLVKGGTLIRSVGFVDVAVYIFCILGMFVGLMFHLACQHSTKLMNLKSSDVPLNTYNLR